MRSGATAWSSGQPSAYGTMDNLTYAYGGNKLLSLHDAVADIASNQKYDFSDNGNETTFSASNPATFEYEYDANGNMTKDKNKGIQSITYNYLNLPILVDFGNGSKIEWVYTVSGMKLEKRVYTSGTLTLTQTYIGGYVYKNTGSGSALDFYSTEAGRVKRKSNGALRYEYTLADHLGNARVTFTDDDANGTAETLEYSAYYAYGMRIEGLSTSNPDNKFTYNGKELENDLGLNWYHYGARFYDPQLGRWHTIDPLEEFHTPFTYAGNDPINLVDKDGTDVFFFGKDGQNAFKELSKATSLKLAFDEKTCKITATNDMIGPLTYSDQRLLEACMSSQITVRVEVIEPTQREMTSQTGEKFTFGVDAYDGSKKDESGHITAFQGLNLGDAEKFHRVGGGTVGQTVLHAVNEAYVGAEMFPGQEYTYPKYLEAHQAATRIDPPQGQATVKSGKMTDDKKYEWMYTGVEGSKGLMLLYKTPNKAGATPIHIDEPMIPKND